ncbi:MAG: hypothetical protein ACE5IC_06385 [Candidatus Brocadiales bacterium]
MRGLFLQKLKGLEENIRHCKKMVEDAEEYEDVTQIAASLQKMKDELERLDRYAAEQGPSATVIKDTNSDIKT